MDVRRPRLPSRVDTTRPASPVEAGPASTGGRRITFLDGVRGLAASLVAVQHLLADEYPAFAQWSRDYLDLGRVGVVAFFLVSGYVIPLSLGSQSIRVFAIRRFFRLFPVYWVALALLVVDAPEHFRGQSLPSVLLNVLLLHGAIGLVSILPVAWTLTIELLFYVQAATARSRGLLDTSVHCGWLWLAVYALLNAAERVTGHDMPRTAPLFLFVAALGQALYLRDDRGSRVWQPLLLAALVVVPAGAYLGIDTPEWHPSTYSVSYLLGLALFGALYAARGARLPRALVWLGAVSYALYLFAAHVHDVLASTGLHGLPAVLANAVAVPLVAWAVHRTLELPSQRLGRRLTRRPRVSGPAPAQQPQDA